MRGDMNAIMGGWVTWAAVAGFVLLAVVDIFNGEYQKAVEKLTAAGGLIGIGRKIEKGEVK